MPNAGSLPDFQKYHLKTCPLRPRKLPCAELLSFGIVSDTSAPSGKQTVGRSPTGSNRVPTCKKESVHILPFRIDRPWVFQADCKTAIEISRQPPARRCFVFRYGDFDSQMGSPPQAGDGEKTIKKTPPPSPPGFFWPPFALRKV